MIVAELFDRPARRGFRATHARCWLIRSRRDRKFIELIIRRDHVIAEWESSCDNARRLSAL